MRALVILVEDSVRFQVEGTGELLNPFFVLAALADQTASLAYHEQTEMMRYGQEEELFVAQTVSGVWMVKMEELP